ncbi:MAG TPA: adenylyl-sulfate kinase [Ignavibacteriaceae bacterium]
MGLPGSGKTFLSKDLMEYFISAGISVKWFNADEVRKKYNDWDFSHGGRIRQSHRMRELADNCGTDIAICDFVAPLIEMRNNFKADWTIWMDTIFSSRYEDTNKSFIPPDVYDFRIIEQDSKKWSEFIFEHINGDRRRPVFNWQKETVQMLGRWQPWHKGHRALFERAIAKTGQVAIMIRDCQGWNGGNPFATDQVKEHIKRDLDSIYQGQYEIILVPNIVNITYGRDVGYKIEQESFDESITSISATKIRKEMGLDRK